MNRIPRVTCCAVRGSTGCCYYKEPNAFRKYVNESKPDLLIDGGINNKDINAIQRVIEMATNQINCEILLLSGPLEEDWRKYDSENPLLTLPKQQWDGSKLALEQQQLALNLGIEFIDMAKRWNDYLGKSQKSREWFNRDGIHGNDRGKQILGRILEKSFTL